MCRTKLNAYSNFWTGKIGFSNWLRRYLERKEKKIRLACKRSFSTVKSGFPHDLCETTKGMRCFDLHTREID